MSEQQEPSGLDARDDLLYIVDHWPALTAALRPGGGNAQNGCVSSSGDAPLPIDVNVSDLMREIEDMARFYARVLLDEVPTEHGCSGACHGAVAHLCGEGCAKAPVTPERCSQRVDPITTSAMPGLLEQVARRYGHFVGDPMALLGFCDDASDYRARVRKTLVRPAPPEFVGPCQTDNCPGDLYLGADKESGKCRVCGKPFTWGAQMDYLDEQMSARLMTASEIGRALKVLGTPVPPSTIRSWIMREQLVAAEEGLYWLADAKALAESHGRPVAA